MVGFEYVCSGNGAVKFFFRQGCVPERVFGDGWLRVCVFGEWCCKIFFPAGVSVRACVRRGVAVRERVFGEGWL